MNQIIDISWKYSENSNKYSQTLKLYSKEEGVRKIDLLGFKFDFLLSNERYCPGYYEDQEYVPCPYDKILEKKSYSNCYFCEEKQGFKAAFLFGAEPNANMQKYLSNNHLIYLAWFYPDRIKVGTASSIRKFIRPIEQDALVYCYIAKSDGFNIQKLEHDISKNFKLTESIRSSSKFNILGRKTSDDTPKNLILSFYDRIRSKYQDSEEFKDWFIEKGELEVVDLRGLKELYYPDETVHLLKFTPLLTSPRGEGHVLVGTFLGLRGRYTLFENGGNIFAIDEREVIGRNIVGNAEEGFEYGVKSLGKDDDGQLGMF